MFTQMDQTSTISLTHYVESANFKPPKSQSGTYQETGWVTWLKRMNLFRLDRVIFVYREFTVFLNLKIATKKF